MRGPPLSGDVLQAFATISSWSRYFKFSFGKTVNENSNELPFLSYADTMLVGASDLLESKEQPCLDSGWALLYFVFTIVWNSFNPKNMYY